MNTRRDRDDSEARAKSVRRLRWTLLVAVVAFATALVAGIGLGSAGLPDLGLFGGSADAEEADCPKGEIADSHARLCYPLPDGWEHSSWPLDVGPTSGLETDGGHVVVGPLRVLPIDTPTDPESVARVLIEYGASRFDGGRLGDVEVASLSIDGADAVRASAPAIVADEPALIGVTVVVVDDETVSYVVTVVREDLADDASAVHEGLSILVE